MKKRKTILFPTDFSESAASAFRYALLLADKINADIQLLHVIYPGGDPLDYPVLIASSTQIQIEAAKERMAKVVENGVTQVLEQLKNAPVLNRSVEIGTPVQSIISLARLKDIDLIVMGSKGENRSRVEKWFGSVAEGVVRKTTCPVLIVPQKQEFQSINFMAYATNTSDADPMILWRTTQLLNGFNPMIHIVHFFEEGKEDLKAEAKLEEMHRYFEERTPGIAFKMHKLKGVSLKKELSSFLEANDVNLLVMFRPHHTLWDRFFISSTKEMAYYTQQPLLVMPEK